MPYTLNVNGRSSTVDVPPWTCPCCGCFGMSSTCAATKDRLWHLAVRCVHGASGRQAPVRSCQTPVPSPRSEGGQVVTMEGLSVDGSHPLQRAWEEIDVPQCGYCQAGQIMSAAALLTRNPSPTDADIDTAMNGNLCRCATYVRIRQAIHRARQLRPAAPGPVTSTRPRRRAVGAERTASKEES